MFTSADSDRSILNLRQIRTQVLYEQVICCLQVLVWVGLILNTWEGQMMSLQNLVYLPHLWALQPPKKGMLYEFFNVKHINVYSHAS